MADLLSDAALYPTAFRWNGPRLSSLVARWMEESAFFVPDALVLVWTRLGGGNLFESETVLEPPPSAEDIDERNEWLRSRGMAPGFLAFHEGTWVSAIDQRERDVVTLDRSNYPVRARHASIDDWYTHILRVEFADRYGLSS